MSKWARCALFAIAVSYLLSTTDVITHTDIEERPAGEGDELLDWPTGESVPPALPSRKLNAIRWAIVVSAALVLASVSWVVHRETNDIVMISYWYFGVTVMVGCLVAFVVGKRYVHNSIAQGRVLCIVPAYNEDPEGLRKTVLSLLAQTVLIDIVVMDDGSQVPVVPNVDDPRVEWRRQENTGKRGAQVAVLRTFDRDEYDFVLTVDSDSEPYPDACEQLLRAMHDPDVQAATGMIYIRNYEDSWVSFGADVDIGTSCVMMRMSRSMLGALETTSGALALYRSKLLYDHLDGYAVECGTGDDRWLALRALRRGKVVAVMEAGVETDMPDTLKGTFRQRLRWARSWWWMLPYVAKYLGPKQFVSPIYGLIQLVITPMLLIYIAYETAMSAGHRYQHTAYILPIYVGAYVFSRYALSALYLVGRPNVPTRAKWKLFWLGTPMATFLNVVLLTPTRYYALSKLFDNRWQTRELSAADLAVLAEEKGIA